MTETLGAVKADSASGGASEISSPLSRVWHCAPFLLLALVIAGSAAVPGAAIFSEWESFTVYSTFGARDLDLSLAVAPRANIGGQGYALLEVSRALLEATGLNASPSNIRIPVVICGAIALIFFFVIAKRWFGPWPALGATALLAVNPMFSQYQHELIIAMPSLMAFLILVERLQALDRHVDRWRNWLTLSAAFVLVLLLYGPGRVMSLVLVVLWLVKSVVYAVRGTKAPSVPGLLLRAGAAVALTAALLVAIAPTNLKFLNPDLRIFFPRNSENFLVSDSPLSPLSVVATNARILAESLLMGGGSFHSNFLEATMMQGRFPLIPFVIVPVYLAGLIVSVLRLRGYRPFCDSPYLAILLLAVLTSVPILTSSVVRMPEGLSLGSYVTEGTLDVSTLSNYRIVYFLVPAYLAVAVTLSLVAASARAVRIAVAAAVVAVTLWGTVFIVRDRADFAERMDRANPAAERVEGLAQWLDGYSLTDRGKYWASHFQQHLQYSRWADAAADRLPKDSVPGRTIVLATSLGCFPEAPLTPWSLAEINGRNYTDVYLSAYLSGFYPGASIGYVFVPEEGSAAASLGEKLAVYSSRLQVGPDGLIDYGAHDASSAELLPLNGRTPSVVITTTPLELATATAILTREGGPFEVIDTGDVCWQ